MPLDAEELLEEIRSRHQRDMNGTHVSEAVQFYPSHPHSNGHIPAGPVLSDDTFCESDYLLSNPDAAAAIERGEFRSGFDHWINCGKHEGRLFEPREFNEHDYLELNPDVISAIRNGVYASGRDHWLQCGRLEGRRVVKASPLFTARLTRLDSQLRAAVASLEEDPPTPQTLRGRLGRRAISAIRRLLWWYTKPLKRFAGITDQGFREHTAVVEHLAGLQEEQSRRIRSLETLAGGMREQLNVVVSQGLSERVDHVSSMLLDFQASTRAFEDRFESRFQAFQQHSAEEFLALEQRQQEFEQRMAAETAARKALDQTVADQDVSRRRVVEETLRLGESLKDLAREFLTSQTQTSTELTRLNEKWNGLARQLSDFDSIVTGFSRDQAGETLQLAGRLTEFAKQLDAFQTGLTTGLAAEMAAREALEQRVESEQNRTSEEALRLDKRLHEVVQQLAGSDTGLNAGLAAEKAARDSLERTLQESDARLLAGLAAEMRAREALAGRLENLIAEYDLLRTHYGDMQRYAEQTRADLTFHNARVGMFLREVRRRLPRPLQAEQLKRLTDDAQHESDALYVAFEATFRGSRDEVKQRQSIYLSHLSAAQAGTQDRPVVDLGCGRGEWLELLREHQLTGKGVDHNQVMLGICRSLNLDVVEADALYFMSNLPDSSAGAVTAFHVIEHLPFDILTALLDQALRVLKPGGLLILETPNPGNVMVGSQHFYLDPTHLKPLPIPMMQFFVEAKGFCHSHILTLHPNPAAVIPLTSPADSASRRLNELFGGPQDYAIIAERP